MERLPNLLVGAFVAALAGCDVRLPDSPPAPTAPLADGVREAVEARLAGVREAPEDVEGWLELAMTYEANGLAADAVTAYERAVKLDGSSPRAWHHLARARARRGDPWGAISAAERACALAPDYAPAFWRHGGWLLESGRLEEAAAAFTRAREIDPSDPAGAWGLARIALQRGRAEEALSLLALDAPRPPYTHHLLAAAHRMAGDEQAAAAEGALSGPPTWRDPWAAEVAGRRAGIHRRLAAASTAAAAGEYARSAKVLEQLRAEDPRDVNVAGMLADVYLALERPAAAVALLLSTRDRVGRHYRVAYNLGNAHEFAGDDERALAEFEQCLRLHPRFGLAHFRRGRLLARARRDEDALNALAEAERLGQASADLCGLRATALLRLGRAAPALALLEQGCRAWPEALPLAVTRTEALIAHGTLAEAEAAVSALEAVTGEEERAQALRARLIARSATERDEE
ncbi:MAG: tetratricopeptide repeat protein [Planctomycetota bacterium]|nr:tetratricopeptide repeat protein [Planctomycetota bacterium]MDP6763248.1 tetratricopeptide repeat protein [Planctomycetota bacterium]MDP6990827.1 tetratricopeptide repeat protein [Planctomycetota bacterium]